MVRFPLLLNPGGGICAFQLAPLDSLIEHAAQEGMMPVRRGAAGTLADGIPVLNHQGDRDPVERVLAEDGDQFIKHAGIGISPSETAVKLPVVGGKIPKQHGGLLPLQEEPAL
ncbi:MAG: hypothetical protein ABIJ96_01585 [Elusimicrobiota bacterium]